MVDVMELKRQQGVAMLDVELERKYAVQAFIDKWITLNDEQRKQLLQNVVQFGEEKGAEFQITNTALAA